MGWRGPILGEMLGVELSGTVGSCPGDGQVVAFSNIDIKNDD